MILNIYCMIQFIENPRNCKLIYSDRTQICGWESIDREGEIIKRHKETWADGYVHYLDGSIGKYS